jgi:hypothetical protein
MKNAVLPVDHVCRTVNFGIIDLLINEHAGSRYTDYQFGKYM